MLAFARANMRSLRNSLIFAGDPLWGVRGLYAPLPEIRYPDDCDDKNGGEGKMPLNLTAGRSPCGPAATGATSGAP